MDWAKLPSLNALKAFAAVAETGGYSSAGKILNVSHAAVNQQVKALEAWLGVALVVREGRGIRLTPDGRALASDIATGFDTILRGVEALADSIAKRPVQISMSPAFAVEWLMPRLQDFQDQHPDIPLMLNPTSKVVELKPGGVDMAIRYGDARMSGTRGTAVLVSDTIVIGAPSLIGEREIDDPAELIDMPWSEELGTNEVADWFGRRGVGLTRPLMITQMPGNLIMQAVRRGDGVTYTIRAFFEAEIQSGGMTVLFSETAFATFYIATSPGPPRPSVVAVVNWLERQATPAPAASG